MNQGRISLTVEEIIEAFKYTAFEFSPEDNGKTGIATTKDGKQFHTNHGGAPLYEQTYDSVVHFNKDGLSFGSIGNNKVTLWTDETGKVHSMLNRY